MEETKGKQQKYRVWTPTQRAEIGRYSAEHSNTSTGRAMFLEYPVSKQQTVSDFKLAYLKLKKVRNLLIVTLQRLQRKNRSPTLLPENLMKKVIETVTNLRLSGAPVFAAVIRAVA